MLEPLGILSGAGAKELIDLDLARPLRGGPDVFCLVRSPGRDAVPVATALDSTLELTRQVPSWAGLGPGPQVMGIVNVTPDSFSDGGEAFSAEAAVLQGERMLAEGAAILDVGGESTRPGALPVPPDEEQRRILPVIAALARAGALISVDTRNADTMDRALDAGAAIVNDVSALEFDPRAAAMIAQRRCPVILTHMRGTPATMMRFAEYDDVALTVARELQARIDVAEQAGIDRQAIAVDPGFGFAKSGAQSLELLRRLPHLVNLSCPIIAGISRKSFVGEIARVASAQERDPASIAAGLFALSRGASVLRVHNVSATMQAVRVWTALQS